MEQATASLPVLYSFRRCPYAMRARMALSKSGQTCRLREVVLRDKPPEMIVASPKGTVPVIVASNGVVLEESLDIMLWSLGESDPDHWLAPAQGSLADMLALIAENDGPFKGHLDRYKYGTRYPDEDTSGDRAAGLAFLIKLDDILQSSPFLFGDRPSLGDIAIFPFIRQFANTDRDWFDDLPQVHLQKWLAQWLASELFMGIMQKWPVWRAGDEEPLFPEPVSA
jgi:glutathione S-transferase